MKPCYVGELIRYIRLFDKSGVSIILFKAKF